MVQKSNVLMKIKFVPENEKSSGIERRRHERRYTGASKVLGGGRAGGWKKCFRTFAKSNGAEVLAGTGI